jgi:hypothetical protein
MSNMPTEYALNAVNQGVTSLGIKGTSCELGHITGLTSYCSYQWHRPRDREEVIIIAHRLDIVLKDQPHNAQHRHGLLRNGP